MRRRDVTGAALVREWGKHGGGTLVSYAEFWRGLATVLGPGMAHFSHSERKRLFSCVESNREGMVATRALAKKSRSSASLAQGAPQPAGKPRALSVRSRARSEDTESVMSTDLSHRNAARELRMRCRRQRLLSADLAFRCALLDQRPLLCCRLYRSRPAAAAPLESLRRPFAQAAAPELGAFVAPVHGFSGSILAYAEDAATAEATVFADDGLFWCALEAIAAEVDALACRGSRRLRPLVFSVAVEVQADASGSPRRTPWEAIPVSDEGAADAVARDALARGAASGTLVAARLRAFASRSSTRRSRRVAVCDQLAEIAHARAAAFRAAPFGRPAVESALDVEQLQARKAAYQELQRGARESPNIVDSIEEAQAKLEDVEKLGGRLVAWERFSRIQAALGSIQVVCRIRPLIPTDASRGPPPEVAAKLNPKARTSAAFVKRAGKGHTVVVDCEGQGLPFKERAFEFDDVWDAKTTQDEVFESIENLADAVLRGCSASVFAYGATGGGKTYTVVGDLDGETPKLGIAFQSVEVLLASLKRDASEGGAPRVHARAAPETLSSFKFAARMRTIHLDGEHLSEKQKATDAIFAMCGERNERRLLQAYLGNCGRGRRALEHCAPETRRALSSSIDEDEVVLGLLNDRPPPLLSDRPPPPPAAASPRSLLGDEHSELSVLSRVSSAWATSEREQHLEAELDSLRRRLRETEEALEDRRVVVAPEPIAAPAFDDDDEVPAEEDAAADADNGKPRRRERRAAAAAAAAARVAGRGRRRGGPLPATVNRGAGGGDDDDLKVIQLFDPEKQARSPHRRESSKKKRRDRQIAIDFVENEVVGATGCFALACAEEPPSDGESDDGRALGRPRAVDVAPGVPDAADRKVVVSVHRAKIFGGARRTTAPTIAADDTDARIIAVDGPRVLRRDVKLVEHGAVGVDSAVYANRQAKLIEFLAGECDKWKRERQHGTFTCGIVFCACNDD
ncbi:hypothetical protein JL722_14364 [Aureococcus anophagefferens]|nr:hypothetical protein JL722_14364 [Aureococcus anophagefferens]